MHKVEQPKVFCIGEQAINRDGMDAWLTHLGVPNWNTDATDEVSEIIEVMGRGCYMSFAGEDGEILNSNLSRVREGNDEYLANIVRSGHGSVLEHSMTNWQFSNVSRVFTHELVRHRVGVGISQESLRFVKMDDLGMWIPSCYDDHPGAVQQFADSFLLSEIAYARLLKYAAAKEGVEHFDDIPFSKKKEYTSAARRVLPIGTATNIGWSCNIRTLRHVIEMRTDPSAEEEIRIVFEEVGRIAKEKWPALFADYDVQFGTDNKKV